MATAPPTRNTDAASGRMKPVTIAGMFARSALSTIAGNAASDEREANATACAGAHSETNAPGDNPPVTLPTGYTRTAHITTVRPTTTTMYESTAPAADSPSFEASGTAR